MRSKWKVSQTVTSYNTLLEGITSYEVKVESITSHHKL